MELNPVELKQCPFCGDYPRIKIIETDKTTFTAEVICESCKTSKQSKAQIDYKLRPEDYVEAINKATENVARIWNRRP